MTKLYGIKQCDTVRAARKWLQEHGVTVEFHDVREDGISDVDIARWSARVDWQTLVNRRSTTWKQLEDHQRDGLNGDNYAALLTQYPTLIKRPVLETGDRCVVGFKDNIYRELFARD